MVIIGAKLCAGAGKSFEMWTCYNIRAPVLAEDMSILYQAQIRGLSHISLIERISASLGNSNDKYLERAE
jgi:hypothetical protein